MLMAVEEQHPLKQGLKQAQATPDQQALLVEEQHPLKQGLKLNIYSFLIVFKVLKNNIH